MNKYYIFNEFNQLSVCLRHSRPERLDVSRQDIDAAGLSRGGDGRRHVQENQRPASPSEESNISIFAEQLLSWMKTPAITQQMQLLRRLENNNQGCRLMAAVQTHKPIKAPAASSHVDPNESKRTVAGS